MRIRAKFLLDVTGMLLIVSFLSLATLRIAQEQADDALQINLAGRQRMLSETMAASVLRQAFLNAPAPDELNRLATLFETTLTALIHSGGAPLGLDPQGGKHPLHAVSGPALAALQEAEQLWPPYREALDRVLRDRSPEAMEAMRQANAALVSRLDRAVALLQAGSEEGMRRLLLAQAAGLVLFILLGAAILLSTTRHILRPLERIGRFADQVRQGSLDASISGTFSGEMLQLKETVEGMVGDLRANLQELLRNQAVLARTARIDTAMAEMGRQLLRSAPLHEISELVVSAAKQLTESPIGYAGFVDPDTGAFCCDTLTPEILDACAVPGKMAEFHRCKKLCEPSGDGKGPVLANARESGSFRLPPGHLPVRRYLAAPALLGDGALVGQIALANSPRDYTQADMDAVLRLSDLYALAVQRQIMDRDLRRARDKAEASDRAKTSFLAAMSHELKTPIHHVRGLTDLLLADNPAPRQQEDLANIRTSADNLLAIVNQVLEFASLDSERTVRTEIDFSLQEALGRVLEYWGQEARRKGLSFDWTIREGAPAALRGDPNRLARVASILLSNAVKYTEQGGVRFEVEPDPHAPPGRIAVRFLCRDTGAGLAIPDPTALFGIFTQAEDVYGRRHGGIGLSLAIAAKLVESMGGTIAAEGNPDGGALFQFTAVFAPPEGEGLADGEPVRGEAAP